MHLVPRKNTFVASAIVILYYIMLFSPSLGVNGIIHKLPGLSDSTAVGGYYNEPIHH